MVNHGKKKNQVIQVLEEETEKILRDAEIVARWAKKPFYIA